ncbi:penicillin-binding protein 1A [Thiosulfativibrio zosterae]|uniref:Penicillin-binding protein 1A n=1 Tax=Thiosulfativibrio zosterae TaxID=2675053 RepID=A0A6F8PQR0_9GAMM|nr:penicillin-binding protein 1A [Thiosulfativibrio zosterae]BBP44367.1 peptidase [Thiosulfativibrio zosterae]
MTSAEHQETPDANLAQPKKKKSILRRLFWGSFWLFGFILPSIAAIVYGFTIYPTLPDANQLRDVTYEVPLKIVTQDGKLITEIGTKKRIPLDYTQIPEQMTHAIISAEDNDFFNHGGVDYKGLGRAVFELVTTGSKQSGGSTITMQVARNFFLTKKKTYLRKLNEIVLSYKIEHEISKQEILALYLNKIFLGYRSYGVAAAAQTYYDKTIDQLTLDEFAMIAGLPKAPSAFNPIANPERAKLRRNYVLRRMFENHYITEAEMVAAQAVPVHAKLTGARIDIEAGYVAEMGRQFALDQFGEEALNNGLTIVTTLDSKLQDAANLAIRNGLQEYERRHGYRGPIKHLAPTQLTNEDNLLEELNSIPKFGKLGVAAVMNVQPNEATLLVHTGETSRITLDSVLWARRYIDVNKMGDDISQMGDVLSKGDLVYVQALDNQWQLAQDPLTESALISISPKDGRILALVGGFDFFRSKFNRVTMAQRQVGSNIKPFLYSAALDKGMTAATTINDAPVVFHDDALEDTWRPENYSGRFYGPTRLREGLAYSRNLVSIRLLQQLGISPVIDYLQNFGFTKKDLNTTRNLSLALGAVQFTPWEVVRGYATFANTGYLIEPYLVKEVRDFNGRVIYESAPKRVCTVACNEDDPLNAPRVITPQNAYIMTSIMQDVINYGSGRQAKALNREDLAGKTGTTNQQKDAWFSGFNPDVVTTVWAGFDKPDTMGRNEVGGRAALPIWMDYMRIALTELGSPNAPFMRPDGLVNVPIDKKTGLAVPADTPGAYFEIFRPEFAPKVPESSATEIKALADELFK